jgi:hypothetical protein
MCRREKAPADLVNDKECPSAEASQATQDALSGNFQAEMQVFPKEDLVTSILVSISSWPLGAVDGDRLKKAT